MKQNFDKKYLHIYSKHRTNLFNFHERLHYLLVSNVFVLVIQNEYITRIVLKKILALIQNSNQFKRLISLNEIRMSNIM